MSSSSSSSQSSRPRFHYGYLVVLTFIVICFGPIALTLSCAALFFTSVAESMGTNPGVASYFMVALFAVQIVVLPYLGKLINRLDIRVFLSAAVVLMAASFVLQSLTTAVWQYIACGLLSGIGLSCLQQLGPSTLINRWFDQRSGFFIGLCFAFTGIGGVVWSALAGNLILLYGWRTTCLLFAVLTLVLALPFTLLVVRNDPAEKGLEPFGAGQAAEGGGALQERDVPAARAFKARSFVALIVLAFLLNFGLQVYQLLPSYCSTLPLAVELPLIGATVASIAMAAQTIAKIVEGATGERFPLLTMVVVIALGIAGMGLFIAGSSSALMIYVGAAAFGCYYAIVSVMLPIVTRRLYGTRDYSVIYARVMIAASLGCCLSCLTWGTLVSVTGSYVLVFGGECVVFALAIAFAVAAMRLSEKERALEEASA